MSTTKKKALIVDDLAGHRDAIRTSLHIRGFEVRACEDGLQALHALEEQHFEIVFTDIEMPNMNGFELLARLRRLPGYERVPVVILSSLDAQAVRDKAHRLGATATLHKPYTNHDILEALRMAGF